MDPTTAAAAPTGFVAWIMANGQVAAFIGQMAYWLVLGVAAIWAVVVFNRYVNFMMRGSESDEAPAVEEKVSIEEFVE
jgi:hypothetical protein